MKIFKEEDNKSLNPLEAKAEAIFDRILPYFEIAANALWMIRKGVETVINRQPKTS